jgi:hypothetical protein
MGEIGPTNRGRVAFLRIYTLVKFHHDESGMLCVRPPEGSQQRVSSAAPKCIFERLVGVSLQTISLYHFPHTPNEPLRKDYNRFPWVDDPVGLRAWQKGRTGISYRRCGDATIMEDRVDA